MLPFIRTLFDIALLRKGPESIPKSGVLMFMSLVLWALAAFTFTTLVQTSDGTDIRREVLNFALAIGAYYFVIVGSGHPERLLQTVTALIGCGALMALCFTAALVLVGQLGGNAGVSMLAIAYMVWSLSVEGHIISRAIDRVFYVGVLIAFAIFIFQFATLNLIMPRA